MFGNDTIESARPRHSGRDADLNRRTQDAVSVLDLLTEQIVRVFKE